MDPRLLRYYNKELEFLRELGGEFAQEYPKVAGRLGMSGGRTDDPYVERLLEGFAFLASRVHLRLDAEFPKFTQHLLELVYPHYLAPLPSMAVVQLEPNLEEAGLQSGFVLPKGSAMFSPKPRGEQTACEYRTGQELTLWPLEITEARYFGSAGALGTIKVERLSGVRAGIRLSLRTTAGLAFDQLDLDELRLFIKGSSDISARLYEQMLGNCVGVLVRPKGGAQPWSEYLSSGSVRAGGFDPDESLLPASRRQHSGYRLLQEYFAFPQRFGFVYLQDLRRAIKRCAGTELEIIVLLGRRDAELEGALDESNFALNCTPVINLFPKRSDRVHLDQRNHEYQIVADRTRPMDYEVWGVNEVQGFGSGTAPQQTFEPLFAYSGAANRSGGAFYTVNRKPRLASSNKRGNRSRSEYYIGSETFVALVDGAEAPYASSLRQLEAQTLCTNRDLPLLLTPGQSGSDFNLDGGAPVVAVRIIAGPTRPRASAPEGDMSWRLISHLSLNYLSLTDTAGSDNAEGAQALRALLGLYADSNDQASVLRVEGLKSIVSRPATARLPVPGPVTFGRGVEVTVTCEEGAYEGSGLFLFGKVLEEFFASYVTINSFTETIVRSTERGEIMKWQPRLGQHPAL